ncbi:hypothetical protein WSM22_43790 [Cytophagales bacterium WSM2-2]|nr:hypothetical protein WSM22_43790 [Cytophagales bacterium WSM2-2]
MAKRAGNVCYFLALILVSCSGSDVVRISDQSYFPLRVGNFQIYQVSETNIQHQSCTDTSTPIKNYQLKALIYDSAKNPEGGYTYYIHRYTRSDSLHAWTDLDSWNARVANNQVIVTTGNVPYLRLVFPFTSVTKWNANLYNDLEAEENSLKNINQSYQLPGGKKFPTTQTVVQSDNDDIFVKHDVRFEVYAPSAGLIYKETTQLEYFQQPCYGDQKVRTGLIYTQSLLKYGRE